MATIRKTIRDAADKIARISRAEIFRKNLMAQYRYEKSNKSKLTSWESSGCLNTGLPSLFHSVSRYRICTPEYFFSPFLGTLTEGELSGAKKIY